MAGISATSSSMVMTAADWLGFFEVMVFEGVGLSSTKKGFIRRGLATFVLEVFTGS